VEEVLDGVQALDPSFFAANPEILFELKRCEFLKRTEAGDVQGALQLARDDLRPLADRFPGLLGSLKTTLATLLQSEHHPQGVSSPSLAASLQVRTLSHTQQTTTHSVNQTDWWTSYWPRVLSVPPLRCCVSQSALRKSLGLEEPALIQILRTGLKLHSQWFRLQRWEDRFESLIGISAIKVREHRLIFPTIHALHGCSRSRPEPEHVPSVCLLTHSRGLGAHFSTLRNTHLRSLSQRRGNQTVEVSNEPMGPPPFPLSPITPNHHRGCTSR
jgi:hypothetical protein